MRHEEEEQTTNRNTIYMIPFKTKVTQCIAGGRETKNMITKEQKVSGLKVERKVEETETDTCHHYASHQPHDSVSVHDPQTFIF